MSVVSAEQLGERLKQQYEAQARLTLPANQVLIVRLDGRAFHTYTRGLVKPFDAQLRADLTRVAEELCAAVSGCALAYSQSDEISLVLKPKAQPWFGGNAQKIASVTASIATAVFNASRQDEPGRYATFDSRCFPVHEQRDVLLYLAWRYGDAVRNSVSAAAQAVFSHRELQGVGVGSMLRRLEDVGQPWQQHAPEHREGVLTRPETRVEDVEYTIKRTGEKHVARNVERRHWCSEAAGPSLTLARRDELTELIWGEQDVDRA